MKRFFVSLSLFSLIFYSIPVANFPVAHAASPGSVVINEIAWMGSLDSTSDEWIELYNTTSSDIDLTGWTIDDDGSSTYSITSGVLPANGYFLIEVKIQLIGQTLQVETDQLDNLDQQF